MRTPRVKLVPPRLPASHVRRPALEQLLEEAERRRLTSIVAGAGFGKSTLAASVALERGWSWYLVDGGDRSAVAFARGLSDALDLRGTDDFVGGVGDAPAEDMAALLTQALDDKVDADRVLVIDDVHELGGEGSSVVLLESLLRQAPPELHLVLCSRGEPPFAIERLRGRGQVLDIDATVLSFSGDEVAGLVGVELGAPIHDLTAGWPAAVQLTAEMLQAVPPDERTRALADLGARGERLVSYVAEEVLQREPEEVRTFLRVAAEFDRFNAELCEAVGAAQPSDLLAGLQRRGLIAARGGPGGWLIMHALLRDFLRENVALPETEAGDVHVAAAKWFFSNDLLREGLASLKIADRPDLIAAALHDHWREYYDRGLTAAVVDASEALPESLVDTPLRHLIGRSHVLVGRAGEGLEWFASLPPGSDRAFEFADVLTGRGRQGEAFEILVEALEQEPDPPHPYCLIYVAFLAPVLGELQRGGEAAERALELANEKGDLGMVADAHAAVADIAQARGDVQRAEEHYRAAREIADRAGNLLALCAAQTKTARFWTVHGRYDDALQLNETATALADRIGFAHMRSEGRHVRARLLGRRGRFDEAAALLNEALALDRSQGRSTAWDFVAQGDHFSERGDVARARNSYEQALEAADPRIVRLRSIALGGLARSLAADDPDRAAQLADEAVEVSVNERPDLLLAAGWVAWRRGELERAKALAEEAEQEARRRRARSTLAESLELRAFCSSKPQLDLLEEALVIRRDLGEPVAAARVELALARTGGDSLRADTFEKELRELGYRDTGGRAAGVLMAAGELTRTPLALQTLGGFRVVRQGEPVPPEAWRSKKARDLLKILAAKRGKPVPRDVLIEALWPEEDTSRTGNRLSVALSTLRSVLDPDRAFQPDTFVASTDGALRLSLEDVELDVESFLTTAAAGLRQRELPLLEVAEAAYTGDFLEEDRYEDWAEPLRDEARATYIDVLRALADATRAPKYFLRIIDRDPYDEQAHLGLVAALDAAGSHGEARRAYRTYLSRMQELELEPAAFPAAALSTV